MVILQGLEIALFTLFSIKVLYLFVFSVASRLRVAKQEERREHGMRRIVILIPAYKEDKVIMECVESCLCQDYPSTHYDAVVISDKMSDDTNRTLSSLPIQLEIVHFENSTKAKALNLAMSHLEGYDIALILDADNTIGPDFLRKVNQAAFTDTTVAYQAHRTAKNLNTNLAYLDAVSEEINNSIFRQGHVNLGFSSALIGSGMAFQYDFIKNELAGIHAVGGFDRALELSLFKDNKRIGYLPDAYVWDEKIQNQKDFANQRRRWLSAQFHYLVEFLGDLPSAIKAGKWDFCDKMFQQMSLPRVIILGVIFIMSVVLSFICWPASVKWWILLGLLLLSLALAIPKELYTRRLCEALISLPGSFWEMFLNLFRLRGANKKFIHTEHGVKQ